MDERLRFVIRLKEGESMTSLCREFGISRKTGYKILDRFEHCGVEGLSGQTRKTSLGSAQDLRAVTPSAAFSREGTSPQHHPCHS